MKHNALGIPQHNKLEILQSQRDLLEMTIEDTVEGLVQDGCTNIHQGIIELIEPQMYRSALYMSKYNQVKAAKALGVSRGTLRTKLRKYFGREFV